MGTSKNNWLLKKLKIKTELLSPSGAINKVDKSPSLQNIVFSESPVLAMTLKSRNRRAFSEESNSDVSCDVTAPVEPKRSILKKVNSAPNLLNRHVQFNADASFQTISNDGEKSVGTETLSPAPFDKWESRRSEWLAPKKEVELNIRVLEDKEHGKKLCMTLKMDNDFSHEDISVKSNMAGNKLRIVAKKIRNNAVLKEFKERFTLPVEINPILVDARLDALGLLKIYAPLAKKEVIQDSDETKSDIADPSFAISESLPTVTTCVNSPNNVMIATSSTC